MAQKINESQSVSRPAGFKPPAAFGEGPYDPQKVEGRIYELWLKSGVFNPDKLKAKKPFTIVLPPPNITGSLHMGHALNTTVQDILIRWRRMRGHKTLWLPGTDHAGIATQNAVEKDLKKQGLTRQMLGREKFLEKVWEWREKYGHIILDQLKTLGASCDWSRTRFTLDADYAQAVTAAFIEYYKKGWVYRADRAINWCPRCATSLSDLELEYEEENGKLWYIKYPLKTTINADKRGCISANQRSNQRESAFIVVATTRPETMLGDMAVAVNPRDERYKDLTGRTVILPIQNREIPVIADPDVDQSFGTGAVKVTPNHDLTDFEIARRHGLPNLQVINEQGRMTDAAGPICAGMTALDCRAKVAEELERQGFLEKIEDYRHRVSRCYRCQTAVQPLVSKQWFLQMDELAGLAVSAVKSGQIKFVPGRWARIYLDWLKNIRDWCVSRQIWWGHRLPIWFCKNQIGKISNFSALGRCPEGTQFPISKQAEEQFVVAFKKPTKCPLCGQCEMEQSADVLDTWFSSALWPLATLGWPAACGRIQNYCKPLRGSDLEKFYPTDVLSTARDIINLWVTRMAFSGMFFMKKIPFHTVYVHATVLTKEGKRMSKSLGTGVDPLELIQKYGADATRFGLIYQMMGGQDLHFSEEHILAGKKFGNKIWNASRFVLTQTGNSKSKILNSRQIRKSKLTKADNLILKKLDEAAKTTNKRLEKFEFGPALHELHDFFWHDFCDRYIEISKRENTPVSRSILLHVLINSLKMLHPFMPFISEEIYRIAQGGKKDGRSLMTESYPGT